MTIESAVRLACGITFMLVGLFVGALALMLTVITPLLVLLLVYRPAFHTLMALVSAVWFNYICALLELVGRVRIRVHLHNSPESRNLELFSAERSILLSNHICHTDWYPLLCVLARFLQLNQVRIFLKSSLKNIPGFGWGLQAFLSIFLRRSKAHDAPWIHNLLRYTQEVGQQPSTLMLFPEGTVLKNIDKSHAYAEKQGLPRLNNVLYPRTGALQVAMRERHQFDAVYDCTLCYTPFVPGEVPSELSFVKWRLPPRVDVYIRRFPISRIPEDEALLDKWLQQRYVEKDKLIADRRRLALSRGNKNHDSLADDHVMPHSLLCSDYLDVTDKASPPIFRYLVSTGMMLCTIAWFLHLASASIASFLALATGCVFWIVVGKRFSGLDELLVRTAGSSYRAREPQSQSTAAGRASTIEKEA